MAGLISSREFLAELVMRSTGLPSMKLNGKIFEEEENNLTHAFFRKCARKLFGRAISDRLRWVIHCKQITRQIIEMSGWHKQTSAIKSKLLTYNTVIYSSWQTSMKAYSVSDIQAKFMRLQLI